MSDTREHRVPIMLTAKEMTVIDDWRYANRIPTRSRAIRELALAGVVSGWQPISTAPKDGTKVDLWCINHLHYAKAGQRVVNVAWGPVRDWMGNEREDWCHGFGEDLEPTHWRPLPTPPENEG